MVIVECNNSWYYWFGGWRSCRDNCRNDFSLKRLQVNKNRPMIMETLNIFNSIYFFIAWIGRPKFVHFICNDYYFEKYNLNPADFADMRDDEIREVFINWED